MAAMSGFGITRGARVRRGALIGAAFVVLGALLGVGCGGRQGLSPAEDAGAAGTTGATGATIGPVDLAQAPSELTMTCDHGIGTLGFLNPCLVGQNLAGNQSSPGFSETECQLAGQGHPVVWSFLLPLMSLAEDPNQSLTAPAQLTMTPTGRQTVALGDGEGLISEVDGTLTFSRIDPTGRAFIGNFQGTVTWTTPTGTFTCAVDGPLWGAPGQFL
jgi:hypothetical protein